ncbi:low affinity immunoglobulin gamma Fc region receptor II-a-like [Anabas testudineus]|uniref:low affinity immunoglobulin gamma Fc region receptor II-a-like n=1 Tax=Anabas testudineus TaxID=64144 RepID=UPI000E45F477|nr:low affinity immunoglobulin gamma Fc region receptor II-a-like [Anabas testudineus]
MEVTMFYIRLLFNLFLLLTAQSQNSSNVQKAGRASLHINPNRLQFFEYESLSLSCVGSQGPTEWRVMKKLPSNSSQWETSTGLMYIKPAFASHSGEYFCENEEGERSRTVNVSVTAGEVILDISTLPVMVGETLILPCRKQGTSSKLPADFFKNGNLIKTEYTGEMTIYNISMFDEGFYKCSISGPQGESPESWLAVTGTTTQNDQETFPNPLHPGSIQFSNVLSVIFTVLSVVVLLLAVGLLQHYKHRVSCFSSEPPTPESDPTYEQVGFAVPQTAVYAKVKKQKKKTGCGDENVDDPNNVMYTTVTNDCLE